LFLLLSAEVRAWLKADEMILGDSIFSVLFEGFIASKQKKCGTSSPASLRSTDASLTLIVGAYFFI